MPRFPGGVIRKTPVTPAGPFQNGAAPGVWTLAEAAYWQKQGLWPVAGNFLAVEDVFSTYLYTGNGSTQTITNGIDLAGKGGMVWTKIRNQGASGWDHVVMDTVRGVRNGLNTNLSNGSTTYTADTVTSFNSNGYSLGADASSYLFNWSSGTYASWTFRKAPKFFDVVTWTGNGTARSIPHSLGVAPGCIIVKRTDTTADWQVYHRSNANTEYMVLNTTAGKATGTTRWNSTTPTATEFTVGTDTTVNASGGTYVAYLFAHDATADGIIQCGSYTGNGSTTGPVVNLGWEPQWLLVKVATTAGNNWLIVDNMRGMPVGSADATLSPNLTSEEFSATDYLSPTATGFQLVSSGNTVNGSGQTYIYIAIRRGPMKTPTVGTSVFSPNTTTSAYGQTVTINFAADLVVSLYRDGGVTYSQAFDDRLRGFRSSLASNPQVALFSTLTNGEANAGYVENVNNTSWRTYSGSGYTNTVSYSLRRAPGFFDVVCYTGTGVARTVNHNLGVAPEMMIVKVRNNGTYGWFVYAAPQGATKFGRLDLTNAFSTASTVWNDTTPTASVFSLGAASGVNDVYNYIAYLFASCPGVSKVGSYTGNGSSQTINCGFSSGARFFLVKRTDSTGDWWVYDSARGIVAAADPALRLNSTAAEVTSADAVDTDSTGIIVNQEATCNINVNGATYIFLAIA